LSQVASLAFFVPIGHQIEENMPKKSKKSPARKQTRADKPIYVRLNRSQLLNAWLNDSDNVYVGPIFPSPNHSNGRYLKAVPVSWWRDQLAEAILRLGDLQHLLVPAGYSPVFKAFRRAVTHEYCKSPDYGQFSSDPAALYFWRRDVETEMALGLDPPLHPEPLLPNVNYTHASEYEAPEHE
jgi:hypothetical protein